MMPSPTTQTVSSKPSPGGALPATPQQAQINAVGIRQLSQALQNAGMDGATALRRYNDAVRQGPQQTEIALGKLQQVADTIGYDADIRYGVYQAPKPVRPAPTPEQEAKSSTAIETGKAFWNGLVDAASGISRLPQAAVDTFVMADALRSPVPTLAMQIADNRPATKVVSGGLQAVGDFATAMLDHAKVDLDTSGKYDQGLIVSDGEGGYKLGSLEGAAHSIGSSAAFMASMLGPGLAGKVGTKLGIVGKALKAAQAEGNVERVAELTRQAIGTDKATRFLGGVVSQLQPLYQDALDATGNPQQAARFAGLVAPVVAAVDAFTGVESMLGKSELAAARKGMIREALGRMGTEVTEDAMIPAARSFIDKFVKDPLVTGAREMAIEGITETGQEAYTKLVENIFDATDKQSKFAEQTGDTTLRMLNSLAMGGAFGFAAGGAGRMAQNIGAHHPAAFAMLQDAYRQEGKVGLQSALDDLADGADRISREGGDGEGMKQQLGKMASVIQSFKNPYTVAPKTQFQYYDLNYNQLPDQQQQLDELRVRRDGLIGDQPTDIDEQGNPYAVDPVVAQRELALLMPQIEDQGRRVSYLEGVRDRLAQTGTYQDWGKGFDLIGKFQPGDRVRGTDADTRDDVDGTVAQVSPDGQTVTLDVTNPDGTTRSVDVRATEVRDGQIGPATTPVQDTAMGDIAVGDSIRDGFQNYQQDDRVYQPGERVVLASNPDASFPVTDVTPNEQGDPVLTIQGPQGELSGTMAELTDKANPNRLVGSYSPTQALAAEDGRKQAAERQKKIDSLNKKVPAAVRTALDAMTDSDLIARYNQATDASEKQYIELLAEQRFGTVNLKSVTATQASAAPDPLEADTPTVDPYNTTAEDISDEQWNQLAETDEIPDAVVNDMAVRLLDEVNFSERQQMVFEQMNDTELLRLQAALDSLTDKLATEPTTDNGNQDIPISENPDRTPDPIGSPGETAPVAVGPAAEGAPVGVSESLPVDPQPVRTGLEEQQSADVSGQSSPPEPAPAAEPVWRDPVRPNKRRAARPVEKKAAATTAPLTDTVYREFRQSPADYAFPAGVLEGIATRILDGSVTNRDMAVYQNRRTEIDNIKATLPATTAQGKAIDQAEATLDEDSDELGETIDRYEQERQRRAAEDSAPSDQQIDEQLRKLAAGDKKARRQAAVQAISEPIADGEEIDIDGDLSPEEITSEAATATPADEVSVGTIGTTVKVLLSGGKATQGVIVGKGKDGDVMVRRMNRQGTMEEDFPHPPSSLLSPSGKAISIDPSLPAYNPPTASGLDAKKLAAGQRVIVPGATTPRVVADIVSVNPDGSADVRVVLSGATRTVPASQMSEPTATELTQLKNKLAERADTERRQGIRRQVADQAATPVGEQALSELSKQLRKAFPRLRVVLLSGAAMQEQFGTNDRGRIQTGTVYLNTDGATADTPIHEFAHAYMGVIKRDMPSVYERGLSLVEGTEYEARVRQQYPELTSRETVLDEALVTAIGEKGAGMQQPSKLRNFLTWAKAMLTKIGSRLGIPVSLETTLDSFATARASELLSGYKLSDSAGEGIDASHKAGVPLPSVVDENWLVANGSNLDSAGGKELVESRQVIYDPVTDTYSKVEVDLTTETNDIRSSLGAIKKEGGWTNWLVDHANFLDPQNMGRVLFGESERGKQWKALIEGQLAMVAPMKVAGHEAFKTFYALLDGKTTYRGAASAESVERWDVTGSVAGQAANLKIPVDIAVDIAMQYRTIITTKGHFDPKHREKTRAGIAPTMQVQLPNPEDPKNPIIVDLDKQQLRALEDRVFNQDASTMALVQKWNDHTKAMYGPLARIRLLMTGQTLDNIADYYPITTASTEQSIMGRSIERFIDDAGYLKDRNSGAPARIRADGFLASVNRYQNAAEDYVQLSPLWQNLKGLAQRQQPLLNQLGYDRLQGAINKLADSYAAPNAGSMKVDSWFSYDLRKLLKLATLSRFAFNVAIPLKQTTGFLSAYGSGAIKQEYLNREWFNYMKLIGQSYALVGRGGAEGNYGWLGGGDTAFDTGQAELRSIGTPDAAVLLWRSQGQTHPDIHFDEWSRLKDNAGARSQLTAKLRSFLEEYGLSISQRADSAVVYALFNAAKAQVAAESPEMPPQQQLAEAATRAKEALYYSNQTFDKTDKAAVQFTQTPVEQYLLLYKGQGVKIFNTLARRQIEVTQAKSPAEKAKAKNRLYAALTINALMAPLITTAVDMSVAALRNLTAPGDDKDEGLSEEEKQQQAFVDGGFAYLSSVLSQVLPAELGEMASGVAYMASNPVSRREYLDSNPLGSYADLYTSLASLGVGATIRRFSTEERWQKEMTKSFQQALRAGAVFTGMPMEAVRQINNGIGQLWLPEERPRRQGRQRDNDYAIEYLTGQAGN
ncbi:hypothetical protein CLV58_12562 [Spirosoma oryzae]|uniref:Large polyvalent protein associated domain-containing protein n=1 Tax=Spirosoma oryzae TaxID=1469603 RepID=A0A2T0S8P9_9BACT|nr:hypothetical protein [Spirosoma oryzae]PRY29800.1 hypothetical protein CLV58_12562 [Spirosoma oryzae]